MKFKTPPCALRTLLGLVAGFALAPPSHAMTAVKRDFPQLVARAEQIVVGTVTHIRQEEDASGTPNTLVTLSNVTALKGGVGSTVTIRFYGGTAGSVVVQIPDMPTFAVGERDVLFIAGNGRDICPLVGVWQGRFRIRHTEHDTDVVEDSDGQAVMGLAGRELMRGSPHPDAAAHAPMTLDAFSQIIVNELAHPSGDVGR